MAPSGFRIALAAFLRCLWLDTPLIYCQFGVLVRILPLFVLHTGWLHNFTASDLWENHRYLIVADWLVFVNEFTHISYDQTEFNIIKRYHHTNP